MASGSFLATVASHPFTLGTAVGVINGVISGRRKQAIEVDTALAILIPTLVAEAYLAYKNPPPGRSVLDLAASTGAGLFVELSPFIRWNKHKRGLLENKATPPPSLSELYDRYGG